MDVVWALVALVAAVHAAYALSIARRLDRVHQRVDAAAAALDDQLRVRATAALSAADGSRSPTADALVRAATQALAITGLGPERGHAESALSRALGAVDTEPVLVAANARAGYARAFFNDTVRDALVVRRRRIVRVFRLAGSARLPAFFEMDEAVVARRTIGV